MTYFISISFFFLCSGTILSQDIVKRPSFNAAPFTFTSSAIVNDLANCLCISQRQFARSFTIADDVKVNGAELKDGLLTISCERIVPEYKKKKVIEIK